MATSPKNILVIRNDKLGDFMLAYPTFQAVKQLFPDSTIYALVPEYTSPMAQICPWIDRVVIDSDRDSWSGLSKTMSKIKELNIGAALCLHSTPRIALALFLAGIPHRFAPASRIDQIMYNHTLTQRRSRSEKPEYEYNLDLSSFMGKYYGVDNAYTLAAPLLTFPVEEIQKVRSNFFLIHDIEMDRKLVFIHAGSGGSASNLPIEQYAKLIKLLSKNASLFFILTAGPGEEATALKLSEQINNCDHIIHRSNDGLIEFAKLLTIANIFISGSTGTLHLAGVLNVPTVAFYPARKSATSLRWQTLNSPKYRLAFTLAGDKNNLESESFESTCLEISNKYLK